MSSPKNSIIVYKPDRGSLSHPYNKHAKEIWSSEREGYLICLVRKARHLWDPNNKFYQKRNLKQRTYEEIGKKMSARWPQFGEYFVPVNVMKKFQNLKTYFQREYKKSVAIKRESGCPIFTSKWEHFDSLSYLAEFVSSDGNSMGSKSDFSITGDGDLTLSEINENLEQLYADSSVEEAFEKDPKFLCETSYNQEDFPETDSSSPESSQKKSKTEEISAEMYQLVTTAKYLKKLTDSEFESTPDEYFTHYIASSLKSIENPVDRELCRIDMIKVLIKYMYKHKTEGSTK